MTTLFEEAERFEAGPFGVSFVVNDLSPQLFAWLYRGPHAKVLLTDDRPALTEQVRTVASAVMEGAELLEGPLMLVATLHVPRSKWMVGARHAPRYPFQSPGLLPGYACELLEGMTGVVFRDPAQVCDGLFRRRFAGVFEGPGDPPRLAVLVRPAI